jgi:hypothetical protein
VNGSSRNRSADAADHRLRDPPTESRHHVRLAEHNTRREIGQSHRDPPVASAAGRKRPIDESRVVTARRDLDVREGAERLCRERSAANRVPRSHHGNETILQQRRATKALAHGIERADRDVELSAVETVEHVDRSTGSQIELHERCSFGRRGYQRGRDDDRAVVVDGD